MVTFKEHYFSESSLSRIWQFVEQNRPFGVISAFLEPLSDDENEARHAELKKMVRGKGLGFVEMEGGWTEDGVFTSEKSLFIPNISRDDAIAIGKHFDEYSVLHNDGEEFVMVGTNEKSGVGKVLSKFKTAEGKENITLAKDAVKDFYSALKKGPHGGTKFLFKMREREESSVNRAAYSKEERAWINIYEETDGEDTD